MTARLELERPELVPHARYRWDRRRQQHQIVFPEGVLVLNDTAAAITGELDGRPLEEVIESVTDDANRDQVAGDTREFLKRLAAKGLLRDAGDA